MLTNASSRAFTFVCVSVACFWVLAVSIGCALPALAAEVFNKSDVANSNNITVVVVTFEYKCPSIHYTAPCGCTLPRVATCQPITTPVSDGWPVQIAWYVVVFVVGTIGTVKGRFCCGSLNKRAVFCFGFGITCTYTCIVSIIKCMQLRTYMYTCMYGILHACIYTFYRHV